MSPEKNYKKPEKISIPSEISKKQLINLLEDAGVSPNEWGVGNSKTVDHFLNEINTGESRVFIAEDNEVQRHIDVVAVEVLYISKRAVVYGLYEDRQEFHDGRIRRRNLSTSIGEKMKPNEEPEAASKRALKEELNIDEPFELREFKSRCEVSESNSYPGVTNYCNNFPFIAIIEDDSFNPDGYIEKQADKTNYYVWKIING